MTTPLIVMFIGPPGSGKTYFGTRLAKELGALRLNSDALRLSMFGSLEEIEMIRHSENRSLLYDQVFGAMNYATEQALLAGYSVVYDAQQAKRSDRKRMEALASKCGAIPILVWLDTEPEVAIYRSSNRDQHNDSHRYDEVKSRMLVERFAHNTDLPEIDENLIKISGETKFEDQYAIFQKVAEEFQDNETITA